MAAKKKKSKQLKSNQSKEKTGSSKNLAKGDKKGNGKAAKKGKSTSTSPRVAKLMARYKNARSSDVSSKVFVAESPVHGKGLFAAKRIKANTVLGRLQGMPTHDDGIYVLWVSDELGLELTNDLKFINHNSDPNVAYSDLDVTVLQDVEPGEELLHDYGW